MAAPNSTPRQSFSSFLEVWYVQTVRAQMVASCSGHRFPTTSSVPSHGPEARGPFRRPTLYRFTAVGLLPALSLLFFCPFSVYAYDTLIPAIYLNEEQKGEFFVLMDKTGDLLIKVEDLKEMGLPSISGRILEVEGAAYLSLSSVGRGLEYAFDADRQTLKIQVPPEWLARKVWDFSTPAPSQVQRPKDTGLFFNYGLQYNGKQGLALESFGLNGQLGVRIGNLLFLSEGVILVEEKGTTGRRLLTNAVYDHRERKECWVLGDTYASSGDLGSSFYLGGLGVWKNYKADPRFPRRPLFEYQGYVTTPSEVSVYVNGVRIGSEKLSPGGFDIRNLLPQTGLQEVEIVIKDVFGREQRLSQPLYVSDAQLGKGLHDYAYFLGFRREQMGTTADRYGDLGFLGYHRYGLTSFLTLGWHGEFGKGIYNLGGDAVLSSPVGALSLSFSGSRKDGGRTASAYSLKYSFQGGSFNAALGYSRFEAGYSTLAPRCPLSQSAENTDRWSFFSGLGWHAPRFGSLSFYYYKAAEGADQNEGWQATYTRNIGQRFNLMLVYAQRPGKEKEQSSNQPEFYIHLTYYPWKETMMANLGRFGDTYQGSFQVQKTPPPGEGFGYRASVDVHTNTGKTVTTVNPYGQYKGRYGIYTAQASSEYDGTALATHYYFSASGAFVYAGGAFGLTRPVDDAFAIVQVGEIPGVRVYHNNQEIGRTDRSGKLIIPNFLSYDTNQVRIEDKDIPLNFSLKEVTRLVSPGYRSGTLIRFDSQKVQAFTGFLKILHRGKTLPVEYHRVHWKGNGRSRTFQTGRDGEFFLEEVEPGDYQGFFTWRGRKYVFDLSIPHQDDLIIEGGEILIPAE